MRKAGKELAKSARKDVPIVLKGAPKQMVKKKAKSIQKMSQDVDKVDRSRKIARMEAHKHMKEHAK